MVFALYRGVWAYLYFTGMSSPCCRYHLFIMVFSLLCMNESLVLGVGASPRKGGNSDLLLSSFLAGASSAGADVKEVQLRDLSISSCVGCEACRKTGACERFSDDMDALFEDVIEAKGIVLCSPTYNYNVTSMMKTFIDRLYPLYLFWDENPRKYSSRLSGQGRKAAVMSVCEQLRLEEIGFSLEAMAMPLEALGYDVLEKIPVLGHLHKGSVSGDDASLRAAREAGTTLAQSL